MTVGSWLKHAANKLAKAEISSGRLDSLILLEDALHRDRTWLLAHPETEISTLKSKRLERKLARRIRHEPLAYIRGHTEFYGRSFKINRHVLEPRPESETMIDLLKKLHLPAEPKIADVGTGCGAIGITIKLELPRSEVDLYDISSDALAVAKHNEQLHELKLHTRKMNLLARPLRPYDAIVANLPYVPANFFMNQAAKMEPRIATYGGQDGLDVYRKLFAQLQRLTWRPKYVLTEALPPQHERLSETAQSYGYRQADTQDFIQVFTVK